MRKPIFGCLISVLFVAVSASAATWTPLAPLPGARCTGGSGLAVLNDSILVVGQTTHDEYSITGDAWSSNTAYPRTDRTNLATAVAGNDVFFVGGTAVPGGVDKNNIDSYNQVADAWLLDNGNAIFANGAAGTIFNAPYIYSFGGTSFGGASLAFRFVPGSPTIFVLLSMPTGRVRPAVVAHGGKLWAIGGTQGNVPMVAVEGLDVVSETWSFGPQLPVASIARAAGVVGGDIHVLLDAGLYRLVGGTWMQVGPPAPQTSDYAAVFAGNTIHAIGGCGTDHYAFAVSPTMGDTTAPTIASITASPSELRVPNHKMVPVTISVAATDDTDPAPAAQIVSVTSNEADEGLGDGDTAGDIEITGPLTLNLRSERSGKGDGRVYTITVQVADSSGNIATGTTTVIVPRK